MVIALFIFGGLAYWLSIGAPLPFGRVPSTAGKLAFVSNRDGHRHLWMMDAATGAGAAEITTGGEDSDQPAWNPTGTELAFISLVKGGVTPQVFTTEARPAANAVPLTNSSASKDQPHYGSDGRIYYLAAGKLSATDPATRDTDQIFPEADMVRAMIGTEDNENSRGLLTTGGIVSAAPSPDGDRIAIALRLEHGQALLVYHKSQKVCTLLGLAERVLFKFLPDGKLLAVFGNGTPLKQPGMVFNDDMVKSGATIPAITLSPPVTEASPTVIFDAQDAIQGALPPLPFAPDSIALSPDGNWLAIGLSKQVSDKEGHRFAGLILWPLSQGAGQPGPLLEDPVKDIAWSPDSKHLAFVSGKDIFTVPADRSASPTNLTKGQGENTQPQWSPAKSDK